MNRRQFLAGISNLAVGNHIAPSIGSELFNPCLATLPSHLAEHELVKGAWDQIDPAQVWDCHTHLVGVGDSATSAYANPRTNNPFFVRQFVQRLFYMNSACLNSRAIDGSYVERLRTLLSAMPPGAKAMLLAFEPYRDSRGNADWSRTTFHTPNSYARDLAHRFPDRFEWVASIHPYREDCVAELHNVKRDGARAVKWLPSAMGIDPSSKQCDAFYGTISELGLPLITHAGHEAAVDGSAGQAHGNPLHLRRALDHGVCLVVAHCASLGKDRDIDKGPNGPWVDSLALFDRLMHVPKYERLLFGDISAVTQRNRAEGTLNYLLPRKHLHGRLLNGSDYPLPGVLPLFSLEHLAQWNLIDQKVIPVLKEVRRHNALLFDFLLKRHVNIRGNYFDQMVFQTRPFFQNNQS
jgi:uncharacterized protein